MDQVKVQKVKCRTGWVFTENFQQSERNYSLVLHELTCIWPNYFYLYQWTSPILGISTEIVIGLKSNNKKLHTQGGLEGLSDCGVRMLVWAPNPKIYHFFFWGGGKFDAPNIYHQVLRFLDNFAICGLVGSIHVFENSLLTPDIWQR